MPLGRTSSRLTNLEKPVSKRKSPTPAPAPAAKAEFRMAEDGSPLCDVNFDSLPEDEAVAARVALEKYLSRSQPIAVEGSRERIVKPEGMDKRAAQWLRLLDTFGTASGDFMAQHMGILRAMSLGRGADDDVNSVSLNSLIALVGAIGPEDELEGALAVQMASCHKLASECLSRASTTPSTEHMQAYANLAVKLQRTFAAQIEALARLRGGANQSVRVEHVHVHDGGQAIVGNVGAQGGEGGRGRRKKRGQPDATEEFSRKPALRSPDAQGDGVPIPGGIGSEAVQDARRDKSRRATWK